MTFPESLRKDFDVLESHPSGRILAGYHVRERKHGGREFMLRLLPDSFCRDKGLVESFHEFFTRFASISNKSYTPQVYSVTGAVNGPVYVLEEYISGISLTEFVKKKGISSDFNREFIEVLSKVCEALHHAHQKDIYHLCITPEDNIVDELTGRVKLVGFGAQIFVEKGRSGSVSPEVSNNMSPEILAGKALEPSADVFSLARAIKTVCSATLADSPVLSKALSDDSSQRYATARDFESALNSVLDDVDTSTPPRTIYTPLEAKGGLKPAKTQKVAAVDKERYESQTTINDSPPRLTLLKFLAWGSVGLIVLFLSLYMYLSRGEQTDLATIKEALRIACLEKEEAVRKTTQLQNQLNTILAEKDENERLTQQKFKKLQEAARQEKEEQDRELTKLKGQLKKTLEEKEEENRLAQQKYQKLQELARQEKEDQDREITKLKEQLKKIEELLRNAEQRPPEPQKKPGGPGGPEQQSPFIEKQNAFLQKLNQLVRSIEKGSKSARQEISKLCRATESMNLIRSAADSGNADAQFLMGRAYHLGDGVSTDYGLARYWYTKAADQQSAGAECNLGYMYHEGKGVARDRSSARYWFTRAAQHGDTDAQRMLDNEYGD